MGRTRKVQQEVSSAASVDMKGQRAATGQASINPPINALASESVPGVSDTGKSVARVIKDPENIPGRVVIDLSEIPEAAESHRKLFDMVFQGLQQAIAESAKGIEGSHYNTAKIRELMTECYSPEELIAISYDSELSPVYNEFSHGMGKDEIIQRILDYARRRFLMASLLLALKQKNPVGYSKYEASIGRPERIPIGGKIISLAIPVIQMTKYEDVIDNIIKSVANELKISPAQARYVYIRPQFIIIIFVPDHKADELQELHQQQQLEDLKAKYEVEKIEVADGNIKLSSSSRTLTNDEIDQLKREIAGKLGISSDEIHFEYSGVTLITIALPGEKVDELLRLDREEQLEAWKKSLDIKQIKLEDNLDRYIQIMATLSPSPETPLSQEVDELKKAIASELNLNPKQVRLPTWESRLVKFTIVLPTQVADKLKTDKPEDLGI